MGMVASALHATQGTARPPLLLHCISLCWCCVRGPGDGSGVAAQLLVVSRSTALLCWVAQRWVSGVFLLQFSLFRGLSLFSGVKCLQFVLPQRHGLFVLCDVLGSLVG